MNAEDFVEMALRDWLGCAVTKIPVGQEKTPDFLAVLEGQHFLIEVKTKAEDPHESHRRYASLDAGELFESWQPLGRKNTLSGLVRDVAAQLGAHAAAEDCICLAWFVTVGYGASARRDQVEATLYGSTTVADWSDGGGAAPCYYFTYSDFFRFKEVLDGAVVSNFSEARLLLNNHSRNYARLRHSSLRAKFGEGVCDPPMAESEGKAFIVDGDVDRVDEGEVLTFLRKKYKQDKLTNIAMHELSVGTLVPAGAGGAHES